MKIWKDRIIVGLFVVLAVFAAGLGSPKMATAALDVNDTDTASVKVTVSSLAMIDISPNNMSFETMNPGETKSNYTNAELSGVQKQGFQIENVGSVNITHIWLNVTQPKANPFGTGDANNYNAANFVAIKINGTLDTNTTGTGSNNGLNTEYSMIDRLEYNASRELVYLNLPPNKLSYGRLRAGMNEYFWVINGSSCTVGDNPEFRIGAIPHNKTDTGTIDLVGGSVTSAVLSVEDAAYNGWIAASTNITVQTGNGGNEEYLILATNVTCNPVRFVKWNADVPGADALSNKGYIFDTESAGEDLTPADSIAMDIQMRVPWGTIQGNIGIGTITVFANTV
ncbi:MAG: hypothetical protein KAT91_04085 [Candidatus Aenigmarchaeota archaeon]|nr:hypothetical protein [Candidatus Aenigmarchaeota archaeon]